MKLFKKIAIVGTGLIGGSIGMAIKKKKLSGGVIGISRRKESLRLAHKMGSIDKGSQYLGIIKDVDLIILATPVETIIDLAPRISKIIKKECIVTDVGSTKREIALKLSRIFPNYIGSHPLAGSEKRGVMNADPEIFKNSLCILTPLKNRNIKVQDKIKALWNKLGARVVILSPDAHDRILSFTSHLPHIIAFSLMNTVPKDFLRFASTSLKDATRIAASDEGLWADIFLSNQKNILKTSRIFLKKLSRIQSAIRNKDKKLLSRLLSDARKKRTFLV